jgi:hypothetical protein
MRSSGIHIHRIDPTAARLALSSREMLIPNRKLLPAVAATQPARVAVAVAVYHGEDSERVESLPLKGFWRARHVMER